MKKILLFIIMTIAGISGVFASDGKYIIYTNNSDGAKLYRKTATGSDNGTAITSVPSLQGSYSPNGAYIVYRNDDDFLCYRKTATGSDNGTAITQSACEFPKYSPDGTYIYFINQDDGNKIYKKSANDSDDGNSIIDYGQNAGSGANSFAISPDGLKIAYRSIFNNKVLIKWSSLTDVGTGANSQDSTEPVYSPDGTKLVWRNNFNNQLKWQYANAVQNGTGITVSTGANAHYPAYSPDGNSLIYINFNDGNKIYYRNIDFSIKYDGVAINSANSMYPAFSMNDPIENQEEGTGSISSGNLINYSQTGFSVTSESITLLGNSNTGYLETVFQILKFLGAIAVLAGGLFILNKIFSFIPK